MNFKMASPRADSNSTPICRCRVLYLGSSVPHITKDGLQGIQEPLRELYPDQGASGARGIDSWLSVWSNGLLLENVDENHKKVTRFFPIDSLHYCAAVRYVLVQAPNSSPNTAVPPRFLPLDSPFARNPNAQHPPLFAAILRRTTGIKVLECHAFICKREMAANALVKCCFHAYADASYAKQIDGGSKYSTLIKPGKAQSVLGEAASSIEKVEGWRTNTTPRTNGHSNGDTLRSEDNTVGIDDISIYNGDENHKVWAVAEDYSASTLRSVRSMGGIRNARPRQIIAPAKTPPPPPLPLDDDQSTLKKNKKLKNKNKNREEFLYGPVHYNGVSSLMRPMRGPHSVSGTMMRPVNDGTLMRPMPPPHMNGYGPPPPHMVLVSGRPMPPPPRMVGTYSHRPKNMRGMPAPFLGPPPPQMMTNTGRRPKHYQHQEEPIYMPSNSRPLSPGASYHPGNFPHDQYVHPMLPPQNGPYVPHQNGGYPPQNGAYPPQNGGYPPQNGGYSPQNGQYATQNGQYAPQNGAYSPQNGPYVPEPSTLQRPVTSTTKKSKKSKKDNNMDDGTDSPFNTGIYRKKGHLNERAFSYSIRQEHRSRSYGSLASLKFSENGSPIKEDSKKEREIMQMMQDLELSGDELQHSPGAGPAMVNGNGGTFETRPRNAASVGRR